VVGVVVGLFFRLWPSGSTRYLVFCKACGVSGFGENVLGTWVDVGGKVCDFSGDSSMVCVLVAWELGYAIPTGFTWFPGKQDICFQNPEVFGLMGFLWVRDLHKWQGSWFRRVLGYRGTWAVLCDYLWHGARSLCW
jgi:hypothetical protein